MFDSMAPINIQMAGMGHFVYVYFLFDFLLKCDIFEETVQRLTNCDAFGNL